AARGRGRGRERLPPAVPGRPARSPGRAPRRDRDHRTRRRAARGARHRLLVVEPRAGARPPDRAALRAREADGVARGGVRALEGGGGDVAGWIAAIAALTVGVFSLSFSDSRA